MPKSKSKSNRDPAYLLQAQDCRSTRQGAFTTADGDLGGFDTELGDKPQACPPVSVPMPDMTTSGDNEQPTVSNDEPNTLNSPSDVEQIFTVTPGTSQASVPSQCGGQQRGRSPGRRPRGGQGGNSSTSRRSTSCSRSPIPTRFSSNSRVVFDQVPTTSSAPATQSAPPPYCTPGA